LRFTLSIQKAAVPEISWLPLQGRRSSGMPRARKDSIPGRQIKLKLHLAMAAVGQVPAIHLTRLEADDVPKFPRKGVLKACFFVHMN
jgi:hypothetical protein